MGFKLTHIKYRQERQKTNVSERQRWPVRQAWGYQSKSSILHDQSGNFPTSPAWAGTKHWDLALPRQAGGDSRSFSLPGRVASNPTRIDPAVCEKNWLVINVLQQPGSCAPVFSPVWHRSHMGKLCSHLWTPNVELQAHVLPSHWDHRESRGRWANVAFVGNGWKAYKILARTLVSSCAQ